MTLAGAMTTMAEQARGTGVAPGRDAMNRAFSLDGVPDLGALFERRAKAAEQALADFPVHRGLAYGPGTSHRMNIFPAGEGAPTLMFIHGGFWKSLDADLFSFLAPGFIPQGVGLSVIDYPLMPAVRMAEVVQACARAVSWLAAEGGRFGCDPERLFVAGNSAGGHLVAELMTRPVSALLRGGTAISGLFDLEPVTRSFQNDDLALTGDEVRDFSPLRRGARPDRPLVVAVGERETGEFHRQAREYASLCRTEVLSVPGMDHITILLDGLAVPENPLNRAVLEQVRMMR